MTPEECIDRITEVLSRKGSITYDPKSNGDGTLSNVPLRIGAEFFSILDETWEILSEYEKTKPRYEVLCLADGVFTCSVGKYDTKKDADEVCSSISSKNRPYVKEIRK